MEWQPISTAPTCGPVWVYVPSLVEQDLRTKKVSFPWPPGCRIGAFIVELDAWQFMSVGGNIEHKPTHWQPLPDPPTATIPQYGTVNADDKPRGE